VLFLLLILSVLLFLWLVLLPLPSTWAGCQCSCRAQGLVQSPTRMFAVLVGRRCQARWAAVSAVRRRVAPEAGIFPHARLRPSASLVTSYTCARAPQGHWLQADCELCYPSRAWQIHVSALRSGGAPSDDRRLGIPATCLGSCHLQYS
jgi:hypothetical protein